MRERRVSSEHLELPVSRLPRLVGFHLNRWAYLVVLAVFTYLLFPVAGSLDVPVFSPGEISPTEVIAPFDFVVKKKPEEIEREVMALVATVPPIYDYRADVVDTALAATDTLFAQLSAAGSGDSLLAIAERVGLRLTAEEAAYAVARGRLTALRTATRSLIRRQLTGGVIGPASAVPVSREVVIRRGGQEQLVRRDTVRTFEAFLESRFTAHPDPTSVVGDQVYLKILNHVFRASLAFNAADTEAQRNQIRASVDSVKSRVPANMRIVDANDPVTQEAYDRLVALRAELIRRGGGSGGSVSGVFGQMLANAMVLSVFWLLVLLYRPDIYTDLRQMLVVSVLFGFVVFGAWVNRTQLSDMPELIPIPFAAMVMTVLFRGRVAMVGAIVLAVLIASQAVYGGGDAMFVALIGGVAGAVGVRGIRHRRQFLVSVLVVVGAFMLADVTVGLQSGWSIREVGHASLWGGANAVVSAALAFILVPVFESASRITTDLTLLELSDPSRPLLSRLATEAPGTYAHSITMANLCEAACNAIGANGLLARVGCYYHDVGKVKKPHYFVENQARGVNPHDKLKPDASAAIIRNHVREGLELAEEHQLPDVVKAFIPEHHGTMEITYFLERARQRNGETEVDPDAFRYPGPRPQSVETSVVMLADGVEAALRVIEEPTREKLRDAIDHIVRHRIEAGQLEESPITLAQLSRIKLEFLRVLTGAYHGRIDYPASGGGITADFQGAQTATP